MLRRNNNTITKIPTFIRAGKKYKHKKNKNGGREGRDRWIKGGLCLFHNELA